MSVRGIAAGGSRVRAHARRYAPEEVAWIAIAPCALLLALALVLLAPALGRLLFAPRGMEFWPFSPPAVLPEPTEHARYVLALLAPLLIGGAVLLAARRPLPSWLRLFVPLGQGLVLALVITGVVSQHVITYFDPPKHWVYFSWATLLAALVLAALLTLALHRPRVVEQAASLLRDTRPRRLAAWSLATVFTAVWLSIAFNSEMTIAAAHRAVVANVGNFWLDETFAVLDGRPPLVTLNAQYSQLWPYLAAGPMKLLGASVGVWSGVMVAGTAVAMLAIFAVLRRIASSALGAVGLYVPFLATSFFLIEGPLDDRFAPANHFSIFPMRYGGPFLLAWLTLRHVDGARPRHRVLLWISAGIVAANNVEFGIPAFAATAGALVWTAGRPTGGGLARLACDAMLGVLLAAASVALLTLAVAGSLPHFGEAFTYSRIYALEGFGMLPMKLLGLHLAFYATFAAAIAVATVRAVRGDDPSLTAMLMWSGVFGLGAGGYFVGHSHPDVLKSVFSAWALALVLLFVAALRSTLARPSRWPTATELAVFAGMGIALCSVAQTPAPWSQVERIGTSAGFASLRPLDEEHLVAARTRRGEPVAIVAPLGHRIAYDVGVVNVSPYPEADLPAKAQLRNVVAALRAAHGRKIFVADWRPHAYPLSAFTRAGFRQVDAPPELRMIEFVDARRP